MGNKPGHLQIEEAGLPAVEITVNVSVWALQPDEDPGPLEEIRRQLSDRFDMVCYMGRPHSVDILAHMLAENSYQKKSRFYRQRKVVPIDESKNDVYRQQIVRWAEQYAKTEMPEYLRNFIARLYIKHNLESIRAIEALQQGAILRSLIKNRDKVQISDVTETIPLVLRHRVDGDTLVQRYVKSLRPDQNLHQPRCELKCLLDFVDEGQVVHIDVFHRHGEIDPVDPAEALFWGLNSISVQDPQP